MGFFDLFKKPAEPPAPAPRPREEGTADQVAALLGLPCRRLPAGLSPEALLDLWQEALEEEGHPVLLRCDRILLETLQSAESGEGPLPDLRAFLQPRIDWVLQGEEREYYLGRKGDEGEPTTGILSFSPWNKGDALLVRVPAEQPWEIFRRLPIGGWNDCPDAHIITAFCKDLYERFGAMPAVVTGDTLELVPARLPAEGELLPLALDMYAFCSDIVTQGMGSVHALADSLRASNVWYFWWD